MSQLFINRTQLPEIEPEPTTYMLILWALFMPLRQLCKLFIKNKIALVLAWFWMKYRNRYCEYTGNHIQANLTSRLCLACINPLKYSLDVHFVVPPFEPHALLRNGHAMTIVSAFVPRRFDIPPPEPRLFQVDPESRLLAHCHWQPEKHKDVPVIVIVHSLERSSDSNYARAIAERAFHRGVHVV